MQWLCPSSIDIIILMIKLCTYITSFMNLFVLNNLLFII